MLENLELQNRFHEEVTAFVNTGFGYLESFGRKEHRVAQGLVESYDRLRQSGLRGDKAVDIRVSSYEDRNPHVLAMSKWLRPVDSHLVAAVLHGSLGSSEVITYSDFDGLVILRNHVLADPALLKRVSRRLRSAQAIMIRRDPLQHHGWFVLTEFDLSCYCEAYFPSALFAESRVMLPQGGLEIRLLLRDSIVEMRKFFSALRESLEGTDSRQLGSMYELKAFLSRLMLLPAAYVQARDARGIWKKDSFKAARNDFSEDAWKCVQVATRIRNQWPVVRRPLLARFGIGHGRLTKPLRKLLSPRVPASIDKQLDEAFFASVEVLLSQARSRLSESTVSGEV